jgi:phenylacetate-coenzyme A ligase PaaK-like adenylate-forming protein
MDITDIVNTAPYSLDKARKRQLLNERLQHLTHHHYNNCEPYKKIMNFMKMEPDNPPDYEMLPFLPVRLFKEFQLKSVEDNNIVKTLTSSGTSGQQVSRIFLDKTTSANQTKVLTKIMSSFIGNKRLPMIILDSSGVIKDRAQFSARGAGILGFSLFGTDKIYAFDDEMRLDISHLRDFLANHSNSPIFMFGFTFMIWQHFYKELARSGERPDLSNAVLIHGGGWKKLVSESVSNEEFKKSLGSVCGIKPQNIHDYYGMVEQTGSIYVECEYGRLHAPVFSDVLIRRAQDFSLADINEKGIIEVVSVLPESYPGHVLLTEDEGEILGEDDCPCGRLGKYFKIYGRIKGAEIRGCSDTYEQR